MGEFYLGPHAVILTLRFADLSAMDAGVKTPILALQIVPVQLSARGATLRITVKGGDLTAPIEITDPKVTASFQVGSAPGTSSNEAQGLIIAWSRGVAEPPEGLQNYEVSFLTTPGTVTLTWCPI
jgi:hypothetical protein